MAPTGAADSFDFVGNTLLLVDKSTSSRPEILVSTTGGLPFMTPAADGVLDNDTDPDMDALSVFGIVGCATRDRHVRVDVIRERMSQRARDWVDLYGVLLFQIPLVILVLWSALPFVAESFGANEKSPSAGGLPFRWILKSVLPISFALLGAASLARLIQVSRRLFVDEPTSTSPDSATPTSPAQ